MEAEAVVPAGAIHARARSGFDVRGTLPRDEGRLSAMHARARSLLTLVAIVLLVAAVWFVTRTPDVAPAASPPAPPPSAEGSPRSATSTRLAASAGGRPTPNAKSSPEGEASDASSQASADRSARLRVRVFVPPGTRPSAVQVRVVDAKGVAREARLTEEGEARFEDLPSGSTVIHAEAPDLVSAHEPSLILEPGEESVQTFELVTGVRIEGRVVAMGTREPIAGATVLATGGGPKFGDQGYGPFGAVTTDVDGRFTTVPVPKDHPIGLQVTARGHWPGFYSEEEALDRPDPIEMRLHPGGRVHGVVTAPDGSPRAAATVRVVPARDAGVGSREASGAPLLPEWMDPPPSDSTDDSGRFAIEGIPFGVPVSLVASDLELAASGESQATTLLPSAPDAEVHLGLRVGGSAEIRVIDEDGRPVTRGVVSWSTPGWDRAVALTGEGTVSFVNLAPGAAVVEVEAPGFLRARDSVVLPTQDAWPHVVRLSRGAGLDGTVITDAGLPVRFALVSLRRPEWPWRSVHECGTQADGTFSMTGLTAGTYRAWVRSGHEEQEAGEVVVPATGVRWTVRRTARVQARFTRSGETSRHADGLQGHARDVDGDMVEGVVLGEGRIAWMLPTGPWRLRVFAEGFAPWTRELSMDATVPTTDLGDIPLDAGVSLDGIVVDATGKPVAGATVDSGNSGGNGARTAADGTFRLEAFPRDLALVRVRSTAFLPREVVVDLREQAGPLRIALDRGSGVRIRFRFDPGARPPEGLSWRIRARPEAVGPAAAEGGFDPDGDDEENVRLLPGAYRLELLRSPDHRVVWDTDLALEEGKDVTVEIPLPTR